jgi:hypothetical protein
MNNKQATAKAALEEKLGYELLVIAESDGRIFTEVRGVTVIIGPEGAYNIPVLRTYDEGLETAANARILWDKQRRRDESDMLKARERTSGHLNPIINTDWMCSGDMACRCQNEPDERRKHRSLGPSFAKVA